MTTIFERAAAALAGLDVPYANGAYVTSTGAELPDLFITYAMIIDRPAQHADDHETLRRQRVQVSVFCRDGLVGLPDVDTAMRAAGFMPGARYQMPYERETGHWGLACEYTYLEDV